MDSPDAYISLAEYHRMEQLLGKLLATANSKEQALLLGIHKRLKAIYTAQTSDRETIDYLKRLAS